MSVVLFGLHKIVHLIFKNQEIILDSLGVSKAFIKLLLSEKEASDRRMQCEKGYHPCGL